MKTIVFQVCLKAFLDNPVIRALKIKTKTKETPKMSDDAIPRINPINFSIIIIY